MQGRIVVGTQNSEVLEIEEKTGNMQVCMFVLYDHWQVYILCIITYIHTCIHTYMHVHAHAYIIFMDMDNSPT